MSKSQGPTDSNQKNAIGLGEILNSKFGPIAVWAWVIIVVVVLSIAVAVVRSSKKILDKTATKEAVERVQKQYPLQGRPASTPPTPTDGAQEKDAAPAGSASETQHKRPSPDDQGGGI